MKTPIADFVRRYASAGTARLHMPGHKGQSFLGCEALDITEIAGADSLYEAAGIIAESERAAAGLFGAYATFYSTEGSSQCIRAMLALALGRPGASRVIVAARNVHQAFVYAAALLDFEIVWLWPDTESPLCACPVSPAALERTLCALAHPPAAVYLTSPDYLGGRQDIAALADVCHRHGTFLAVDNAHGAYLHFLSPPAHPLDLGADLCCDSAHKTLPVLTGGAYLHLAPTAAPLAAEARRALRLFGSTSPSYLTLQSLDLANRYLELGYRERLEDAAQRAAAAKRRLSEAGWVLPPSDPLKLTVNAAAAGRTGQELADLVRAAGAEPEYADPDFLVLMITPETPPADLDRVVTMLCGQTPPHNAPAFMPAADAVPVMSVRQAVFARHETLPAADTLGRICGAPTVSCPPAVPVVVAGERIGPAALALFCHYHLREVEVVCET